MKMCFLKARKAKARKAKACKAKACKAKTCKAKTCKAAGAIIGIGVSAWILVGAGVQTARAAVVGMAISVKGQPMVVDKQSARRLRLSDRLNSGDKIRCAGGSEAVVVLFASGKRFVISGGKTATLGASNVSGASPLAALSGASGRVAQSLSGSKTGAIQGRVKEREGGINWSRLKPKTPQEPEAAGWLQSDERRLSWSKDPETSEAVFTLFNADDDVVFSERTVNSDVTYPENAPEIELGKPYFWRLVRYREGGGKYNTAWGMITWVSPEAAAKLQQNAVAASEALGKGDVGTALLAAAAFEDAGAYQNALEILDKLNERRPTVPGAFDALMKLYGRLPAGARGFGPYGTQYALWQFRTR